MLTGGGDCPGLNAVIRAVVRKGIFHYRDEFVGFLEGWRGLVENKSMVLDLDSVSGILPRGGTILRTSRTNPSKRPDGFDRSIATLGAHKIDALVAIGGDDTLSVAQKLHDIDRSIQFELDATDGLAFRQGMLNVGSVVKAWEIADQTKPADRSPAHVLDQPVIYLSFGGNHHRAAGEFAVVEGDEKAGTIIESFLAIDARGEWTAVESSQSQKDGGEIAQFTPVAEPASAERSNISGKTHA